MDMIVQILLLLSTLFFLIFVSMSFSFFGLALSELGLWFSWIPIGLIAAIIPFMVKYWSTALSELNFILLAFSLLTNIGTFLRLLIPLIQVRRTNIQFQKTMKECLGEDYLFVVNPSSFASRFFEDVRFRLRHYFLVSQRAQLRKQVSITEDVCYREVDGKKLCLNIYQPNREGVFPTIIFMHGGGWVLGSKDQTRNELFTMMLANLGYVVFSVDYRLLPFALVREKKKEKQISIREMVSDVRAAIHFVKTNTPDYFGDPKNIFLFGRSAGAHLALLTALSAHTDFFQEDETSKAIEMSDFVAVIAFYPVTNLEDLYHFYNRYSPMRKALITSAKGTFKEQPALYHLFSPTKYVSEITAPNIPPIFLTTGMRDKVVDPNQSEQFFMELQKYQVPSVLLKLPWANHAFDLVRNGPGGQLVMKYLSQFMIWALTQKYLNRTEQLGKEMGLPGIISIEKLRAIQDLSQHEKQDEPS